ncbi:MAG: phosphatidylglycerol lysyltransferase domain-containing protein, partial [Campylobacteraceae bacterium]
FTIVELDPKIHKDAIMRLFHKWVSDRVRYMPKEEEERFLEGILFEQTAIKRLMTYFEELEVVGICIFIDNELKGFTVGEKINSHIASIIIEKCDFEVLGCAQFIFREFSKVLRDKYEVEYINVGDDMGFENLKKVKMSYRPEILIPKYTIYQKC